MLTKLYIHFFKNMTLKEFSFLSIPEKAKVLLIGCGSLPHTVIILGQEKNWDITAIDRDKRAVKKAKSMIKKYDLSHKIEIKEKDGLKKDFSTYDLVVIAHDVEPKKKILEKVVKDISEDSFIMLRTTWDLLSFVYGKEELPKSVYVLDEFKRSDFIKTIFMKKVNKI